MRREIEINSKEMKMYVMKSRRFGIQGMFSCLFQNMFSRFAENLHCSWREVSDENHQIVQQEISGNFKARNFPAGSCQQNFTA
jgi:hypothetical protein